GLEFRGRLSFIKGGIVFADALSTVSPSYALEIQTPEMGYGLDGILRTRRNSLHGILNGVDYSQWSPESDPWIACHFSVGDLSEKETCKRRLLETLELAPPPGVRVPLFAMISRLTGQKGIDLALQALPWLLEEDFHAVFLGTGEPRYEQGLRQLQQRWPDKVRARIGFDNALAHQIEAASDFFLMPSRFEPCGLNQMYSLRYGTIPIVRATGGLDDTVQDLSAPDATGIKFQPYSPSALAAAIHRALELYRNPARLDEVRLRGMRRDFSWTKSAAQYEALYRSLHSAKIPAGR
ncbi:MAG TPA: glycosyltransferase, partial [Myxococcaceae bacterium]|nr:glycosyltransferase [Myxococcaceae bacterium]